MSPVATPVQSVVDTITKPFKASSAAEGPHGTHGSGQSGPNGDGGQSRYWIKRYRPNQGETFAVSRASLFPQQRRGSTYRRPRRATLNSSGTKTLRTGTSTGTL